MKLGLVLTVLKHLSLNEALAKTAELGYESVEIEVGKNSGLLDPEKLLSRKSAGKLRKKIASHGLTISAIANHAEGQLVLGPHHEDTDCIFDGTPKEKIRYGIQQMKKTAQVAAELEVPIVCGFCGCQDYSRWFPWPDKNAWEKMADSFVERWNDILDSFKAYGVRFAHECHPKQYAYNIETAQNSIKLLDERQEWGFNFDPANLLLSGVDPILFIQLLGNRIYHVHAKDGEIVTHNVGRSGLLANGAWERIDRGFRFRIPGWGDISWKKILTELRLVNYDYVLAIEHEDPTMSQQDGLEKAFNYLKPIIINKPFEGQWW